MDRTADHDDEHRLIDIERELTADDPALAAALSTVSPVRRPTRWMALAALGTLALFAGFALANWTVVLLGTGGALAGCLVVTRLTSARQYGVDRCGYPPWCAGNESPGRG